MEIHLKKTHEDGTIYRMPIATALAKFHKQSEAIVFEARYRARRESKGRKQQRKAKALAKAWKNRYKRHEH